MSWTNKEWTGAPPSTPPAVQAIKELERRLGTEPYMENDGSGYDVAALQRIARDAIALAKQQQAELEALKAQIKALARTPNEPGNDFERGFANGYDTLMSDILELFGEPPQ